MSLELDGSREHATAQHQPLAASATRELIRPRAGARRSLTGRLKQHSQAIKSAPKRRVARLSRNIAGAPKGSKLKTAPPINKGAEQSVMSGQ
ncbi:hypothetical protein L7F22_006566 [Adiantum nelumboides]|nr:hypothetical protein [Adiantum nelumboides]